MELKLYLQILRRGWWLIPLTMLIALIASLAISYFLPPQYEAVGRFILSPSASLTTQTGTGANYVLDGLNTLDNTSVMATYAEVMNSDRIYNDALAILQFKPEDMTAYTYATTVLPNSSVLELRVRGPVPKVAADIANSMGNQTINFTRRLNQVINIDFLDLAVAPIIPYRPQPLRDAGLALVLGLVGGMGLALLRDQMLLSMEALRQRLYMDDVTGAYTHKHFVRLVEEELVQSPDDVLCIGILELSGLQELVDTFPTIVLQTILQRVVDSLHKDLKGNDVIGRWNDYSFAILLPHTPGTAANRLFERISASLAESMALPQFDMTIDLDAHIGGAEYGKRISTQALFARAFAALERSRTDNKNPFWTQKIDAE